MLNLVDNTTIIGLFCGMIVLYFLYEALCFNLEDNTSFEYTTTLGDLKEGEVFAFESNQEVLYEIDSVTSYKLVGESKCWDLYDWNKGVRVVVQGVLSE
jgi:hypothetical protein